MNTTLFAARALSATALGMLLVTLTLAEDGEHSGQKEKCLYVWAGDQAHRAPDFLAVINFDEDSDHYGGVIKTVPLPPPGNIGNEPHHCHLNATGKFLACGGLLSVLKNQK